MPSVTLNRVTKIHRDRSGSRVVALRDVSLDVGHGEHWVVVGPSGSGKSTLLRLMAGLDVPTEGTVLVGERAIARVPAAERGVAIVFQDPPLFPHRTVEGNLCLGLELRRIPKPERDARVEEALAALGLAEMRDRLPETLSGGERQRVALGMAFVMRPAVVLLDEPLAQLDPAWRARLRREFREWQRRSGGTWIQTTHDQAEALASADRLVVLERGELRQVGTPEEVYAAPANRFVAGFLGTPPMNLIEGRFEAAGNRGWRFVGRGGAVFECPADAGPGGTTRCAGDGVFGVRPEAVRRIGVEGGDLRGDVVRGRGTVVSVEFGGHDSWAQVRMGTSDWIVVRVAEASAWKAGSVVEVGFSAKVVHRFEASRPEGER